MLHAKRMRFGPGCGPVAGQSRKRLQEPGAIPILHPLANAHTTAHNAYGVQVNNKTIEILMFLLGYLKENNFDDESLSEISENLVVQGYSENEIAEALELLLDKLNFMTVDAAEVGLQKKTSFRVLSDFERSQIPPGLFGYLLKLRGLSLIDGPQMEKLIDFMMVNDARRMTEDDVNEIVAALLFDEHI